MLQEALGVSHSLSLIHILVGYFGSVPHWIQTAAYNIAVNEQEPRAVTGSNLGKTDIVGKGFKYFPSALTPVPYFCPQKKGKVPDIGDLLPFYFLMQNML